MRQSTLALLRCPDCRCELTLSASATQQKCIENGVLACVYCGASYPINNGMPQFIQQEALDGLNKKFARFYDFYSKIYRPMSVIATYFLGGESKARGELLGRLPKPTGKLLDIAIGSGRNLPVIMKVLEPSELHGIDISAAQLNSCHQTANQRGWNLELASAMAEALPYADNTFDSVLHVGGINFFNDQRKALEEMIRVAKPGANILVADETERGAKIFDWFVPGFSHVFQGRRKTVVPPVNLLPEGVLDVRLNTLWRGMAYCIQFRKSAAVTADSRSINLT